MYFIKSEVLIMIFSIDSIVLWPRNKKYAYKRMLFEQSKINIITGASKTGKSAIIPIIDYCLCSDKCSIPVETIRDTCEWFGVLFHLENENMLLCRKEPGGKESTGEMLFLKGQEIEIPDIIVSNTTAPQVRNMLNELFRVSFLETDSSSSFYTARPSFRDFMAFQFQPQNIIANADVLFYKADTTEHREKLIKIFPYVLGAVTPEILSAKQEIEYLTKRKEKKQKELLNVRNVTERWKQDILSWLSQARELGLTNYIWKEGDSFLEQIHQLRLISEKFETESIVSSKNISNASDEIIQLRKEEQETSSKLYVAQKRYAEMRQLSDSIDQYDKSLQIQLKRLDLSSWLRSLVTADNKCPLCGGNHQLSKVVLDDLCNAMEGIEQMAGNMRTVPGSFERELKTVKEEIDRYSEQLSAIRNRIDAQSGKYKSNVDKKYTIENISRFLGKTEMVVQTYEKIGIDNELEKEISEINDRLQELGIIVNNYIIQKKIDYALSYIQTEASHLIKTLDVERPSDPIEILYKDLTIRIKNISGRNDYLWEIGSASNWLAYHIAVILAFQSFFQLQGNVSIPNFIVFDQPSQVYFPQYQRGNVVKEEFDLKDGFTKDEDREGIKKVFGTFSKYLKEKDPNMQIIVMEHADEDIWGEIDNIHLVARWRGDFDKLVPHEWLEK
jgi:hypothetical protein